jgi:outer membrane lipoprotein-sorting protein
MRMTLAGLSALVVFCTNAHALSADDLIAKNIQARGGTEKIAAIKDLKLEGKLRVSGGFGTFELTYVQYRMAPNLSRVDATVQGLTQVQAWDGNSAWRISPFQGRKDPERLSGEDAKQIADDADLAGLLVDYKKNGSRIDYVGTEDVDGTNAHKLKVSLKTGDTEYVYLDPDHFLEIRTVAQRRVRGTESEDITDYGDYEQVNGVYFPFSIASRSKDGGNETTITIDKAKANSAISDALFAFPAVK